MENIYVLQGHTRTMSSLASSILRLPPEPSTLTLVPDDTTESSSSLQETPMELSIPLPPSRTSSASDQQGTEASNADSVPNALEHQTPNGSGHEGIASVNMGPLANALASQRTDEKDQEDMAAADVEPLPETFENPGIDHQGQHGTPHALSKDHQDQSSTTQERYLPAVDTVEPASLDRLRSLIASEKSYDDRVRLLRHRLEVLQLRCGLEKRLLDTLANAHRLMASQFRDTDQPGFLKSYNSCEELVRSIDAIQQAPDGKSPYYDDGTGSEDAVSSNWTESLSNLQQESLLAFISRIRNDPGYLGSCLCKLNSAELLALTSSYRVNSPVNSVLPGSHSGKALANSRGLSRTASGPCIDQIQTFHQDDPLFTIVHGIFDEASMQGSWEYNQRIEVLSTACAKVMMGGKRGSDDLAISMLDSLAEPQAMKAQPKLEAYILKVLHDGTSILQMPLDHFGSRNQPVEIQNANVAIAKSNFFEQCSADFFALVAEDLPRIIPAIAIQFVQSVLGKIEDPIVRHRAKNFIMSRWLFCSLVPNILIHPESCGMMMKHHIGETARQGLLKELTVRVQKQIFDVITPWQGLMPKSICLPADSFCRNHHSLVDSKVGAMIERIVSYFDPSQPAASTRPGGPQGALKGLSATTTSIVLSPRVVVSLIKALLPPGPPPPDSTDITFGESTSTASSIAASSTLTSGSTDFGSAVPSSLAPSISGTSMTSNTILSDVLVEPRFGHDPSKLETNHACREAGSSADDSDFLRGSSLELCQSLCAILDSQQKSLSNTASKNWALFDINEGNSYPSLALFTNKELGLETSSDGGPVPETSSDLSLERLGNAVVDAISSTTELWADSVAHEESSNTRNYDVLSSLLHTVMAHCESRFDYSGAHLWWQNIQLLNELCWPREPENILDIVINALVERKAAASRNHTSSIELLGHKLHYLEMLAANQKKQLRALRTSRRALRDKLWYTSEVKHAGIYEETLNVTHALRAMADAKRTLTAQSATSSWAKQRLRTSALHDRSSAAPVLEALASSKEYGGYTKLADNQVELTTRWMTKSSVENFCKGEELVHRFCYEIQRCVNKLTGMDMVDSPVLWSSDLFKLERAEFNTRSSPPSTIHEAGWDSRPKISNIANNATTPTPSTMPFVSRNLADKPPKSIAGFWQSAKPTSHMMDTIPYFKQAQNNVVKSPLSTTFMSSQIPHRLMNQQSLVVPRRDSQSGVAKPAATKAHKEFTSHIKRTVTALLLSDFAHILWNGGTETDNWISAKSTLSDETESQSLPQEVTREISQSLSMGSNSALSDALSDSTIIVHGRFVAEDSSSVPHANGSPSAEPLARKSDEKPQGVHFPFQKSFERILSKFSAILDPFGKLESLAELCSLVNIQIENSNRSQNRRQPTGSSGEVHPNNAHSSWGRNIPRTQATSLEEIMANCTERRAGTLRYIVPKTAARESREQMFKPPDTDATVNALLDIFRNDKLRPRTLYRDLQFITAFVPSEVLDQSASGKAFWDVGLAALAYKEDCCEAMIRRANQITNYHVSANKDTSSFMNAYSPDLVNTSLGDAAQLWVTIAKEGSPIACRELGLFYLTHPELLPRVTLPFSKSKDVFRSVNSSDRTSIDTGGLDPLTFAVVFHWMELAANGGDKDARDFIRGNGELSTARS